MFCFACTVYAIAVKLVGGFTVPGWSSLLVGVFFLGGIQLVMIGILGGYIGKLFFEVKKRPNYIMAHRVIVWVDFVLKGLQTSIETDHETLESSRKTGMVLRWQHQGNEWGVYGTRMHSVAFGCSPRCEEFSVIRRLALLA